MAKDVAEATESLDKEAGLVGLDRPLDQLDLTKMLSESIDVEEQDRSEKISTSGDATVEAEAVRLFSKSFRKNLTTMVQLTPEMKRLALCLSPSPFPWPGNVLQICAENRSIDASKGNHNAH